jgi:quercetin dioxygenase-like cupin family protein
LFFKYQDSEPVEMFPGVIRRTLISGKRIMLTQFTYEKGSFVPTHKHPHEQISCVIQGRYKIKIEGKEYIVEKGDSYLIPPNVEHSQQAIEKTITLDVFSPPREEYQRTPSE